MLQFSNAEACLSPRERKVGIGPVIPKVSQVIREGRPIPGENAQIQEAFCV